MSQTLSTSSLPAADPGTGVGRHVAAGLQLLAFGLVPLLFWLLLIAVSGWVL